MSADENEDNRTYTVVVNHEEQYSIWPDGRDVPNGWRTVGVTGAKQVCLDHIEKVWTDMRPLSLRKKMEQDAQNRQALIAGSQPAAEGEGVASA